MKTSGTHLTHLALGVSLVLGSTACGGDDGAPPLGDSSSTGSGGTGSSDASESGFELACMPGEVRCAGQAFIETCDATGLGWTREPCGDNKTCSENENMPPQCLGPCDADDLLPSSAGCSFIANRQLHLVNGYVELFNLPEERNEVDGLVVANPNVDLTANIQLFRVPEGKAKEEPLGDPLSLGPGEYQVFELDSAFVMGETTMFRTGGMYRVQSDAPVIAYQHAPYRAYTGNDSSMLLPENILGKTYVVFSYPPHFNHHQGLGRPTYFEIIGIESDTTVRWQAQFAATSGNGLPIDEVPEGEWSQDVKMNRFDTLRVTASYNANQDDQHRQDVSGTVIESDKPIWVVGASRCSRVPVRETPEQGFCDPLQELLIPLEYWGTTYVAAHPPLREQEMHHWRIYGGEEGVTVMFDPMVVEPYTFSSRGDFVDISVPNGTSFIVEADGPVMPVGYLESRRFTGEPEMETATYGDPAMYQLVPTPQFLNRYVFVTGLEWDQHWIQIVRKIGNSEVVLDGQPVQDFEQVGEYEFAIVQISEGAHQIESDDDFGISQFGWANGVHESCAAPLTTDSQCHSSYAYPGGMKSEVIYVP